MDNDEPIKITVDEPEKVNPAPDHTPPPVDPPAAHHDHEELTTRVSALESLVDSIVNGDGPDSTPVKKPWTHWGAKR